MEKLKLHSIIRLMHFKMHILIKFLIHDFNKMNYDFVDIFKTTLDNSFSNNTVSYCILFVICYFLSISLYKMFFKMI